MKSTKSSTCPPRPPRPTPPTVDDCNDLFGGGTGPQGPVGPMGDVGPAVSTPYDPNTACSYVKGQIIFYSGLLWVVNQNCPQGAPGSTTDYSLITQTVAKGATGPTGPQGPTGDTVVQPLDPDQVSNYRQGQIILYNGKLWAVLVDHPQGLPGTSADYEEIPASSTEGPTGPAGPQGSAGSTIFDPTQSSYYLQGQLVYYNGNLYVATVDDPQGIPGSSCDYVQVSQTLVQGVTGPTGPTGSNFPTPFDPDNTQNYSNGNIVYYDGQLWMVNTTPPMGTPGQSPDYTLLSSASLEGPAGPPGDAVANIYDPNGIYKKNDLVFYNGMLYVVNRDNPVGPPGQSADFNLLTTFFSATGPAGAQGPTGPQGECSCTSISSSNVTQIAINNSQITNIQNQNTSNQTALDNINNALTNDETNNQANVDQLESIKDSFNSKNTQLEQVQSDYSYCGCNSQTGGCQPFGLDNTGTAMQITQYGTPCQVCTFFGCPVYRQCYFGITNIDGTGNTSFTLPTCTAGYPTMILDYGGFMQYIKAGANIVVSLTMAGLGFPAVATAGPFVGPVDYYDDAFGTGIGGASGAKAQSSIYTTNATNPPSLLFDFNGSNTGGQYRFWFYVDYVDSNCIPQPNASGATGATG